MLRVALALCSLLLVTPAFASAQVPDVPCVWIVVFPGPPPQVLIGLDPPCSDIVGKPYGELECILTHPSPFHCSVRVLP